MALTYQESHSSSRRFIASVRRAAIEKPVELMAPGFKFEESA
jgi:hypothetical protein